MVYRLPTNHIMVILFIKDRENGSNDAGCRTKTEAESNDPWSFTTTGRAKRYNLILGK
jgi:hypothetical protein